MDLKVGDVVRLKSDGPAMTVAQYPYKTIDGKEYPEKVKCKWFKENHLVHKVFDITEIEKQ